jgi:hypothetical protein
MEELTALRRRRTLSSSELAVALSEPGEEPAAGAVTPSIETSESGDGEAALKDAATSNDKRCLGCRMVFGSPELGCIGEDDTAVVQYFKGRGNYCNKCFRLHRACYADRMGLALMEDWLAVEDTRAEWNIRLAASCALRQTGSACVQLKDILVMAQQFHVMAAIFSLPSRPFVVVPLEEYVTSSANEPLPLTIDRVINIHGGSLGVMVCIDMKGEARVDGSGARAMRATASIAA